MRYFSGLAGNKWLCTGGQPTVSTLLSAGTTTGGGYSAPFAQTLVLPFSGLWDVTQTITGESTAASATETLHSYDVGATAADDDWAVSVRSSSNTPRIGTGERVYRHDVSGSTTLTVKSRSPGTTATVLVSRIAAMPVALD